MADNFKTEQEAFWAGGFGNTYIDRNVSIQLLAANISFFADILKRTHHVTSVMEFGANVGMNMHALNKILVDAKLAAVEINAAACEQLNQIDNVTAHNCSILDFCPKEKYDLVFTKGVLIHINPDELDGVYRKMYEASGRYICVAEYYNPSPVAIPYRGHDDRLFKRDFAGEILDKFPDIKLIDYGFAYHRDHYFPQDDITWFLMEKS